LSFPNSYQYVVDPDDVRAALGAFAHQPIIGLDTETYLDRAARQNRISLLQLAAPTGEVLVIDALGAGLEEVRSLIENPVLLMAAHNARFDQGVLRGAGFAPTGLIDTLRMARQILSLSSFTLSSVAEHLFGLQLDKHYQQSNWRQRPLARAQLDYAAMDAEVALRIYQTLAERLKQKGCLAEALRLAQLDQAAQRQSKAAARRGGIKLRPLTAEERKLFEQLRLWRRQLAERERIPAYLVCPDKTLEHLAIVRPQSLEELRDIFGLGPLKIARYGAELLAQLQVQGPESAQAEERRDRSQEQ
jgi:ribonuclease D